MSKSVTSLQNPLVKLAASLHQKKYRDEENLFLVEGAEMISMAVQKKWELHTLFMQDDKKEFEVMFLGFQDHALSVPRDILEKISKKDNPQPVIAMFRKRIETHLPVDFSQEIIPALEEIRDPGNLGTIIRTSHALGLEYIVLIGNCCDPFAPETIRASMGSFAAVRIIALSMDEFAAWHLHHPDVSVIGTDVVDATDYRSVKYTKSILLMGNEQKGLSPVLKDLCDQRAHIPMPGGSESLNVAMATTLLLYEAMRPNL